MQTILSIVSYPFLPARQGGQKMIALFNKYMARKTRLICVTTKNNEPSAAEGYTVLKPISNSPLRYINLFLFFSIRKIIRQEKVSHIIIEHPYYGWLGMLLKWSGKEKLIVHSHNIESLRWKVLGKWWWPILGVYEKWTHRRADFNFFIQEPDMAYAIRNFKLDPSKCMLVPYGTTAAGVPSISERQRCRKLLEDSHGISPGDRIFLFNGLLSYPPNLKAVRMIITKILPLFGQEFTGYKILICGKGLPREVSEEISQTGGRIIYAGFVDDIDIYFKGADVFINPVNEGGGMKTKLVEALAANLYCVSTQSGATGISNQLTGPGLAIVADEDWQAFANAMAAPMPKDDVAPAFFRQFSWEHIAEKAVAFINA